MVPCEGTLHGRPCTDPAVHLILYEGSLPYRLLACCTAHSIFARFSLWEMQNGARRLTEEEFLVAQIMFA